MTKSSKGHRNKNDEIVIMYPLSMNTQTPEEFKREVLKEKEGNKIIFNGFMINTLGIYICGYGFRQESNSGLY